MLKRASFQLYRSLRDVAIDFGPLTVLVGPNGSGKSSVLRGLLPDQVQMPVDAWRHLADAHVKIELHFDAGVNGLKEYQPHSRARTKNFPQAQLVHFDLNALRSANVASRAGRLSTDGSNLTNVFDSLTRKQQGDLAEQLSKLVPTFADVEVSPLSENPGQHRLRFQDRWHSETWYTPAEVSDGTMLLLAYLVLQYQAPQVDLLLVEEPERGLHPYLLGSLVSFLRRMTLGEIGPRAVQIVLATHSADLLDHLEPEEVRLLTRDTATGSVRVDRIPADTEAWQETYRNYEESLGLVWKSGGLRGVPGG